MTRKRFFFALALLLALFAAQSALAFQVRVKDHVTKRVFVIEIESTDSIENLKSKLRERGGYESARLALRFRENALAEGYALYDYNIQSSDLVDVYPHGLPREAPFQLTDAFLAMADLAPDADTALAGFTIALRNENGAPTGDYLAPGDAVLIDPQKSTETLLYLSDWNAYAPRDWMLAFHSQGPRATVRVSLEGLYLRARPSIFYAPVGYAKNGEAVRVLAQNDAWALVLAENGAGYCALEYLTAE